jgi:uncharacterized YigZ family protein
LYPGDSFLRDILTLMESDSYKTIRSSSNGVFKDRGSRFIAFACQIRNSEEIKPVIEKIRKEHHDARHHCFAYMLGNERTVWRANDDGEPSGTGGRPILGQINSSGLTNILIVVSRYFGGTLLGVSGLINAYKSAAADAISNADIIKCFVHEYHEISFPYSAINDVMKIIKEESIEQSDQLFELECKIKVRFRVSLKDRIIERLNRVDGIKCQYIETF